MIYGKQSTKKGKERKEIKTTTVSKQINNNNNSDNKKE
jgi:hypothetical protein